MFKVVHEKEYPTLYYNNKPLHSSINPLKEAKQFAERVYNSNQNSSSFVLFGTGLGYPLFALAQLLKQHKKQNFFLLSIFFSKQELEIFIEFNGSLIKRFPEIKLCLYNDFGEINRFVNNNLKNPLDINGIVFVDYAPIVKQFMIEKNESNEIFSKFIHFKTQTLATQIEMMGLWMSNIINNIPFAIKRGGQIQFTGDVLLVAAGPSLKRNLTYIKNQKGKAPIIALDTALPPLIDFGIIPDVIVSCDAQIYNYYDFFNLYNNLPQNERPVLVADITQNKAISRMFDKIVFARSDEVAENISDYFTVNPKVFFGFTNPMPSGGSVASFALGVINAAGAKRVLMIGQDLSYSFITHSVSSISSNYAIFWHSFEKPLWNYYKKVIQNEESNSMLYNLKEWIEQFFALYPLKGIYKDPQVNLKNVEIFDISITLEGAFDYSCKEKEEKLIMEIKNRLQGFLEIIKSLRTISLAHNIDTLRKHFAPKTNDILENILLKAQLYRKKVKNYSDELYLGIMYFALDKTARDLQNALAEMEINEMTI